MRENSGTTRMQRIKNWFKDSLPTFTSKSSIHGEKEDRISELPNDILISIISRLTFPEAVDTSILSTRWRHLYSNVDKIIFPAPRNFPCFRTNDINNALTLREFRVSISYPFNKHLQCFVEYALARKAEIVAVYNYYPLASIPSIKSSLDATSLGLLKDLSLSGIDVDDADFNFLLFNSPLLECLSVSDSPGLKHVSIDGNSQESELKLKRLEISKARNLLSVKIWNMINLVCLWCYQLEGFSLDINSNVPNLTELGLTYGELFYPTASPLAHIPSSMLAQLRLLKLHGYFDCTLGVIPELINIKHLEVDIMMDVYFETHTIFRLIEACSSLQILEIKFVWEESLMLDVSEIKKMKNVPTETSLKGLSPNMKKLKVSGYTGFDVETQILLFVVNNIAAAALEEFTIQFCDCTKIRQQRAKPFAQYYFRDIVPKPRLI